MKKSFLFFSIAAFSFASCTKSGVAPVATNNAGANSSNNIKAAAVKTPPAAHAPAAKGGSGGGGGNGGGGSTPPPPPTNLSVWTQWQTGTWASFLGIAGSTQVNELQIIYSANGTFKLTATNTTTNVVSASLSGTWALTIPAMVPLNEDALLTLTSGGKTLVSGFEDFFHPGILQWTATTNKLPANLVVLVYGFQKL